jgi:hypothetical protein
MILRAQLLIRLRSCVIAAAVLALWARPALAEEAVAPGAHGTMASESAPVNLMALTAPARLTGAPFAATTWVGFDGAIANPRISAVVEASLLHRLAIAVGTDSSSEDGRLGLRPLVALRFQVLEQDVTGVDSTAALTYRQDRFELDGGFFQGAIALGRRFDRLSLALNLAYGVDPEGDDHEGEVCAAARVQVSPSVSLGVDGRHRRDLGSSDPNRTERGRSESETVAGATAAYSHRRWALMLEAGMSRVVTTVARTAPIVLAGYSATF